MKRIKLTVAYDGTVYCGWQIQPQVPTIESVLNDTLSRILREDIQVIGASRTDAGVHALGNVAVFDTETPIPPDRISYAVNPHLPDDIRIISSCQAADDFHPRFCDSRKTYEYRIQTGPSLLPTSRRYSHWLPGRPDIAAMQEAGAYIVGTHDFKSFCAAGAQVKTTVRTVLSVDVEEGELLPGFHEILIRVSGEGFLYNMVRIIVGTMLKAGFGVWPPEHVKTIIEGRDRTLAGETVPARGLCLKGIEYL
ncbi:MAG: tRNA pseudouridine(38-40) synthase TruA [Eubacterium sp.]|nr:tRNA pseudouridine(38-40) synthase TruA [Eubacterium sp.]